MIYMFFNTCFFARKHVRGIINLQNSQPLIGLKGLAIFLLIRETTGYAGGDAP